MSCTVGTSAEPGCDGPTPGTRFRELGLLEELELELGTMGTETTGIEEDCVAVLVCVWWCGELIIIMVAGGAGADDEENEELDAERGVGGAWAEGVPNDVFHWLWARKERIGQPEMHSIFRV
jgi:hypothetical protein